MKWHLKNSITNQQKSVMSKIRAAVLMLKFTLDTFHFMGFLCETWPWQKAFENT